MNGRELYLTSGLEVMFLTSWKAQIPTATPVAAKRGYTYFISNIKNKSNHEKTQLIFTEHC